MADQGEVVAICLGGDVYHKVKAYVLDSVAWGYPRCGTSSENPYRIHLIPITEVGDRRLCKRCERMEESDA